MPKFSRELRNEVVAANDIVDIIGAHLELKPAGALRFKGLCPFHKEKTPSFTVSRDRQIYHCFGCGKGGDVLSFLCDFESISFGDAMRRLADRASIRLPEFSERDDKEEYLRQRLIELGSFAAKFFRDTLTHPLKGSQARQYLKGRALPAELETRFSLGFAQDSWSALYDAAREAGFKDYVLEASGLVRQAERGRVYDFFRNRIIFPIRGADGQVLAFGGRDMGDGSMAKYINSPETQVYRKSRVLYGLYEGRNAIRLAKKVVLVEGYFDLIRCHEAAVENVVATCGTALTPEQAQAMQRYAPEAVVVYDGDSAGIKAALRATGLLTAAGMTVRVAVLPDGLDPDDFVRQHGAEAFQHRIEDAPDFVSFYLETTAERARTIEGRTEVARELFAILANITDELRKDQYIERISHGLNISRWACRREFDRYIRQQSSKIPEPEQPAQSGLSDTARQHDVSFLALLLQNEAMFDLAKHELAGLELGNGPLEDNLRLLLDTQHGGSTALSQRLASEEARRLYAAASTSTPVTDVKTAENMVLHRLARMKKDKLQAEARALQESLQEARRARDDARQLQLLARIVEMERRIEVSR